MEAYFEAIRAVHSLNDTGNKLYVGGSPPAKSPNGGPHTRPLKIVAFVSVLVAAGGASETCYVG